MPFRCRGVACGDRRSGSFSLIRGRRKRRSYRLDTVSQANYRFSTFPFAAPPSLFLPGRVSRSRHDRPWLALMLNLSYRTIQFYCYGGIQDQGIAGRVIRLANLTKQDKSQRLHH